MPIVFTIRTVSRCLRKTKSIKAIQPMSKQLATSETQCPMTTTTEDQRNASGERTRTIGRQGMSPVRDGLRDTPEWKPNLIEYYYAAFNYTETLEHENDHIMVKVQLHGKKESVTINAMIDSGATEDFIDQEICNKHGVKMIKVTNPREIYLADRKPSAIGPVTHRTKVPMDINSHRELATFQVANLQNHEVILGMPWLRKDNLIID